jgi:hypothetical protein
MNDRLKFRAWDEARGEMRQAVSFWQSAISRNVTVENGESVDTLFQDFTLMQSTGLKDKNGKLIYEGDIVQSVSEWEYVKENGAKCTLSGFSDERLKELKAYHPRKSVEYELDLAGFYPFSIPALGGYEYENWDACNIEVIGNLYENPELITK